MSHVVQIVSRRMVLPEPTPWLPSEPETTIDLTPWDLRMITVEYTQTGVLLPKPPATGEHGHHALVVERLTSSFARALGRFYPYVGRLVVTPGGEAGSISVSLRCSMEGAEFVHAVAPGVTVADVVAPLYTPGVVRSFFPLDGLLGVNAVAGSHPVLAAQVTELADGVFVAMSLNRAVGDGTAFWHLFNTWSEISRRLSDDATISSPLPVHRRWFLDGCRVPIPLPFAKVEDIASYGHPSSVQPQDCFLHFSAESVKKLKAKANAEASATISSLQALLAHLWVAVCRARRLAPDQSTTYVLLVGSRGRVAGIPAGYAGNAVARAEATSTAGEILERGLGRAASLLNKMVSSLDEASERDRLASWARNPSFACTSAPPAALVVTGNSPRFDVYRNDFGWGGPVAVRRSSANKMDGTATVFQGRGGGGSMALEVCLAPEVLARLVTDDEFMSAVSTATA